MNSKFMSMEDAVSLVRDGDTIWINSFSAIASPVNLNKALTARFRATGHPLHLSVYSPFSFSDWREDSDVEGYICEGAADRIVVGFFGTLRRTAKAIMENRIEGYNLPGGVMSHMIRAGAMGWEHLFSKIGLNLFVDPIYDQYKLNARSREDLVRHVVSANGVEGLSYKIPQVNIAFLKATCADERGNISFRDEGGSIDALSVAQATHRNGGKVIVQVQHLVTHHMNPHDAEVPAALVDAVVVCPEQQQLTTLDGYYDYICGNYVPSGRILRACCEEIKERIGATSARNELHKAIAKRAYHELQTGQIVNIGIGIPELVAEEVLAHDQINDIHLSVETGMTGGFPLGGRGFGCSISPDTILDMARQFDFYEGGGLDAALIGALQIDSHGNVNGHYAEGKLSGIGGFANISQATKKVVFCCTFTAKGLKGSFDGSSVHITQEGSIKKFIPNIETVSFSEKNARANDQEIIYITERCVFRLGERGLKLTEVAPGIDLQKDILDHLDFEVEVAKNLKQMEF